MKKKKKKERQEEAHSVVQHLPQFQESGWFTSCFNVCVVMYQLLIKIPDWICDTKINVNNGHDWNSFAKKGRQTEGKGHSLVGRQRWYTTHNLQN